MLRWVDPKIAIGFLAATLFWICALGWQASYAPTERQKQECQDAAKAGGPKAEECKSFWERTTSDPVAFYTLGVFIFTGVLGISTIFLWQVTRTAADAGKVSADALMNAERAHVMLESVQVVGIDEIAISASPQEGKIYIVYRMRNYGRTPAWTKNVTFQTQLNDTDKSGLARPPIYDNPTETLANYAIPPEGYYDTFDKFEIQNFLLSRDDARAIMASKKFLFIFGFVEYVDVFEPEKRHISRFAYCYRFTVHKTPWYNDPIGFPDHWEYK
jgi:hypothetical protein